MDKDFTAKLQKWLNTPRPERNWEEGATLLLQLTGNKILFRNLSVNPEGKANYIEGRLQQYLDFRLAELTHEQVAAMEQQVEAEAKKHCAFQQASDNEAADFRAGRRADHDQLPEDIQALYVENLDLLHRMRELHLQLRQMSKAASACADSDRYPFLKEFIKLDKKLHDNWNTYDHFVIKAETADSPTE